MENKLPLKIYPLAQNDMENIFRYISIELGNPQSAIKLIDELQEQFTLICEFPESCPLVKNEYLKDKTLRKLLVKNYIAFYRVKNN